MAATEQKSPESARIRYMVNDIDAAVAFYTDNFGNPIELFQPAPAGKR